MSKNQDPVVKAVAGLITSHHTTLQVVESLRAALAAEGERLQELLEAVGQIAETSAETQQRLTALEEHTGLKPAS